MSENGGKGGKGEKGSKDDKKKEPQTPQIQNIWVGRQMSKTFISPLFLLYSIKLVIFPQNFKLTIANTLF